VQHGSCTCLAGNEQVTPPSASGYMGCPHACRRMIHIHEFGANRAPRIATSLFSSSKAALIETSRHAIRASCAYGIVCVCVRGCAVCDDILACNAVDADRRSGRRVTAGVFADSARHAGVQDASVHGTKTRNDNNPDVSGNNRSRKRQRCLIPWFHAGVRTGFLVKRHKCADWVCGGK
jgi:hypothetical protein